MAELQRGTLVKLAVVELVELAVLPGERMAKLAVMWQQQPSGLGSACAILEI